MSRAALLLVVSAAAAGCGNLSREDLIFMAAVPPREAIELRPAGRASQADAPPDGQALEERCADGDLRCVANNAAEGINGVSFALLDIIDEVLAHPPSARRRGKRVWGPVLDDRSGITFRFEMVRLDDGVTFGFCLHAARGRFEAGKAGDISCETDTDDSGLVRVFSGQFTPGDAEGARAQSGVGALTLEIARIPELAGVGKQVLIDFDHTAGRTQVELTVDSDIPGTNRRQVLHHDYTREADGSGRYALETFFRPADQPLQLRYLELRSQWLVDQSGRAEARLYRIADLDNPTLTATQCWDAALEEVHLNAEGADGFFDRGDPQQCSINTPLF